MRRPLLTTTAWLLGLTGLALAVRAAGLNALRQAVDRLGWVFAALCLLQVATLLLDAQTLRLAVPRASPARLSLARAVRACLYGLGLNSVTPFGQVGELAKWRVLARPLGGTPAAAAVWLHNQLMFVTSSALFALGPSLAVGPLDAPAGVRRLAWGMAAVYGAATLVAVTLLTVGPPRPLLRLLRRLARHGGRLRARIEATVDGIEEATRVGRVAGVGGQRFGIALALMMAKRLVYPLEAVWIWSCLADAPTSATRLWPLALLTQTATQALAGVAGVLPLQLGTSEGGAYALFAWLGRATELGVLVELVRHARRALFVLIATATWAWERRRRDLPISYR